LGYLRQQYRSKEDEKAKKEVKSGVFHAAEYIRTIKRFIFVNLVQFDHRIFRKFVRYGPT
jgi:hypothetical protein